MEIKLWENEIPHFNPETDTPNLMTFYPVASEKPTPCVVIYPGGGYSHRAPHEGKPIAEFFNSKGIQAAVVEYRVAPNRLEATLSDAQRAVKIVRHYAKDWNVDPSRIVTLGFSAGGHLCAATLTLDDISLADHTPDEIDKEPAKPDGGILCYPVIALTEDFGHVGSGKNLLGEKYNLEADFYSLQNRVSDKTPKCFLWHTSDDGTVNVKNSLIFAEKLRDNSIPFEIHIFPSGRHGLGLANGLSDVGKWPELAAEWVWNNI